MIGEVRAALALIVALAIVPAALATRKSAALDRRPAHPRHPRRGQEPRRDQPGRDADGGQDPLGQPVRQLHQVAVHDPTWLYFYPSGEPVGAGVRFRNNKAVAIFTLGATPGWKSTEGIKFADPIDKLYDFYGTPKYTKCIGYEAYSLTRTAS